MAWCPVRAATGRRLVHNSHSRKGAERAPALVIEMSSFMPVRSELAEKFSIGAFGLQLIKDAGYETLTRLTTREITPPPTWDLPVEVLSEAKVLWPKTYSWRHASKWLEPLKQGLSRYLPIEVADIPQPEGCFLTFRIACGARSASVAVDYSDYPQVNDALAGEHLLYFKMQFDPLHPYRADNVIPGGFVPNDLSLYSYLADLRQTRDRQRFVYDVYGRFSLDFAENVRNKALFILAEQDKFAFEGSPKKTRYSRFLCEVAQSKICIDLPGNGPFCFRLFDYLAVGACVIGPRHRAMLHVPLEERKHVVYTKDDLSDLVPLCEYYLDHEDEREVICRASREYFDAYLHRDQLAAYYLHCCIGRLLN